ncbi:hypothetical protein B0I35DRAFT_137892 [Stachybotrys elegans]|uniref:Uncharacterized protein n=1 Tax=Stachybotrys elegans TaxID=80388 RepID=A0A8K0T4W5_9HYPO|nr:hypothetical protein B0I35DRAFT_137892 [Stachybotrys elegans]
MATTNIIIIIHHRLAQKSPIVMLTGKGAQPSPSVQVPSLLAQALQPRHDTTSVQESRRTCTLLHTAYGSPYSTSFHVTIHRHLCSQSRSSPRCSHPLSWNPIANPSSQVGPASSPPVSRAFSRARLVACGHSPRARNQKPHMMHHAAHITRSLTAHHPQIQTAHALHQRCNTSSS